MDPTIPFTRAVNSLSASYVHVIPCFPKPPRLMWHSSQALPREYPFKPPTLSFRTKIYHPNVTNDDRGAMCLGMLRAEEWKPPNKIADVLKLVRAVLSAPQPDDAVEAGIADQYKNDRMAFDKTAQDWVKKYAK